MRDYIERLTAGGEMRLVAREVDPRFELAGVIRASQARDQKAILFHKVGGAAMPVVSNLYGSHRRLCELIGAADDNFCRRWDELARTIEAAPRAPEAEVDPDRRATTLSALPQITYFEKDAGPYITAGIVLARHPETGVANLSFHRAMHVGDTELRIRIGESHDLAGYFAAAEAQNEALPVALLIGAPPEIFVAACASLPAEADELSAAAAMRGTPLPMARAVADGFAFPAGTEIVIEGRLLPNVRRPEGPFGEFMGYYVPVGDNVVLQVDRVTTRPDPVYHALLCGSPEDMRPLEVSIASRIYRHLVANDIPGVLDVTCRPVLLNTVVKIRKQSEDHPRAVMEAAYNAHPDYSKACIVVDEDIDITSMDEVWWAYLTRGRADTRAFVERDRAGFYRDPSGDHLGRLGIDATMPLGRAHEFERKKIPAADRIDLSDYSS